MAAVVEEVVVVVVVVAVVSVVEGTPWWSAAMMGTILARLAGESAMIAGARARTECPHLSSEAMQWKQKQTTI